MSVHTQFIALALAGFVMTVPALVVAWVMRLPGRRMATIFYVVGFALIGATLIIDPILRPPLFYHGFFPGIGIGAVAIALVLVAWARGRVRKR